MHQQRVCCVLQNRTCGLLIGGAEEEMKQPAEPATGLPAAHTSRAVMFVVIMVICLRSVPGIAANKQADAMHSGTACV